MRKSYIVAITLLGLFSTQAFAECNNNLPYERLVDCIATEGSGAKYPIKPEETVFDYPTNEKVSSAESSEEQLGQPVRPSKALATSH